MEFIREAKKELNMLGYVERLHKMRIRPEIRDGRTKIRGEVRDKLSNLRVHLSLLSSNSRVGWLKTEI